MSNPTTVFIWSLDCESDRQSYSIANCPRRDDGARLGWDRRGQCHLMQPGAFADQAPQPVLPQNTDVCARSGRMRTPGKRVLLQCPVWPVGVAMVGVFISRRAGSAGSRPLSRGTASPRR